MKKMILKSLPHSTLLIALVVANAVTSLLSICSAQNSPSTSGPGNIVASACDAWGTVVRWPNPQLSRDGIPVKGTVVCHPPSGSLFPVGITTVVCEELDSSISGGPVTVTFTVTVQLEGVMPGAGLDTNGNGLDDLWEIVFKAQDLAPEDDTDGDGFTNAQEARAGTDPFDASFRGGVRVAVGDVDGSTNGDGSVRFVSLGIDTPVWGKRYDFQVAPADDTNGYGLTNEQESIASTDPFDASFKGGVYLGAGESASFVGQTVRIRFRSPSDPVEFHPFQVAPATAGPWINLSRASHGGFIIDFGDANLPAWISKGALFRVIVSDVDEDADGLTAWEESILGTSDHTADTGWGQDWLVGGTGQDGTNSTSSGGGGDDILIGGITSYDETRTLSGGGRDVLIGGDGDFGTNSSSGYGGAGVDILIANTGGDRQSALDWIAAHLARPQLREVALAHIGNGPGGLTDPRIVVAAGTGGWTELSSWFLDPRTLEPHRQTNSEPGLAGWTVYLDVLEPQKPSELTLNPFILGRIGADSNLWLSLRSLDDAGRQAELSAVSFGTNEKFRVSDYALAHRTIIDGKIGEERFLLVTPMIGFNAADQLELRVAVWSASVHAGRITSIQADPSDPVASASSPVPTGRVTFIVDSGPVVGQTNLPPKGARLQIAHQSDGRFLVSYLDQQAQLRYVFLDVSSSGVVSERGTGGFTVEFDRPIDPVVAPDFALSALGSDHFATMLPGASCTAQVALWKGAAADCEADCNSVPVLETNGAFKLLGSGSIETPRLSNFALCRVTGSLALSAVVYETSHLRLDAWNLPAEGQAVSVNHSTDLITGASAGGPHVKIFDGTKPVLLDSKLDYLSGRLEDGQLRLDRWWAPIEVGR